MKQCGHLRLVANAAPNFVADDICGELFADYRRAKNKADATRSPHDWEAARIAYNKWNAVFLTDPSATEIPAGTAWGIH